MSVIGIHDASLAVGLFALDVYSTGGKTTLS